MISATQSEKYKMIVAVSTGEIRFEEINVWLSIQYHQNQMIVTAIAAISENHVIGKDNKLLWHLPTDLKHFKDITTGHTVIMGRKTFDSVGKPLPKRRNIIITRKSVKIEGCEVVNS